MWRSERSGPECDSDFQWGYQVQYLIFSKWLWRVSFPARPVLREFPALSFLHHKPVISLHHHTRSFHTQPAPEQVNNFICRHGTGARDFDRDLTNALFIPTVTQKAFCEYRQGGHTGIKVFTPDFQCKQNENSMFIQKVISANQIFNSAAVAAGYDLKLMW